MTSTRPSVTPAPPPAPALGPAAGRARSRLHALDGLRFWAAAGVVLYHFTARWSDVWGTPPGQVFPELGQWTIYGALGPELFFVISGFVILMTAWGKDVPHVVASRVARLYPAYWLAVIATSVLLLWIWPAGKDITVGEALVNLTMLQELVGVRHVDGVYWTLWTELRFYVLMVAFVAWGITRRRILWFTALWPLAAELADLAGSDGLSMLLISGYAPLFAGGMLVYLLHREGPSRWAWGLLGLNVVLAVHAVVPAQMHSLTANTVFRPEPVLLAALTVGCFAVVGAAVLTPLRNLGWTWLVPLGALTYPLYLIHEFWGWWLIDHLAPHAHRWVTLGAACAFVLFLAWVLHQAEKRIAPPMRRGVERALRGLAPEGRMPTSGGHPPAPERPAEPVAAARR